MQIASQEELQAFIKGAGDQFAARGVPRDAAEQLLGQQLQKHAAELGLVPPAPPARRDVIDGFKKSASELVKQHRQPKK